MIYSIFPYDDHSNGQLVRTLLREHSLAEREVWIIGDRVHDFQAARENSIRSLAVARAYGERSEYGFADAIIQQPADPLTFFRVHDTQA